MEMVRTAIANIEASLSKCVAERERLGIELRTPPRITLIEPRNSRSRDAYAAWRRVPATPERRFPSAGFRASSVPPSSDFARRTPTTVRASIRGTKNHIRANAADSSAAGTISRSTLPRRVCRREPGNRRGRRARVARARHCDAGVGRPPSASAPARPLPSGLRTGRSPHNGPCRPGRRSLATSIIRNARRPFPMPNSTIFCARQPPDRAIDGAIGLRLGKITKI